MGPGPAPRREAGPGERVGAGAPAGHKGAGVPFFSPRRGPSSQHGSPSARVKCLDGKPARTRLKESLYPTYRRPHWGPAGGELTGSNFCHSPHRCEWWRRRKHLGAGSGHFSVTVQPGAMTNIWQQPSKGPWTSFPLPTLFLMAANHGATERFHLPDPVRPPTEQCRARTAPRWHLSAFSAAPLPHRSLQQGHRPSDATEPNVTQLFR